MDRLGAAARDLEAPHVAEQQEPLASEGGLEALGTPERRLVAAALHPAAVLPAKGVALSPKLLLDTGGLRRGALRLEPAVGGDVGSAPAADAGERSSHSVEP